jgi:transposase
MRTNYSELIRESEEELLVLERRLRQQPVEIRIRMLRLLKSSQATDLQACATLLGYSVRQISRWWNHYRRAGFDALLVVPARPGRRSQVSEEALRGLRDELRTQRITQLEDVRRYLEQCWGIQYRSVNGVWWLLRRNNLKIQPRR